MGQLTGLYIKVLSIVFYLQLCFGYNIYTYTTQAVKIKEKTHALHYKSEFYDFVQRTFRLSNGNQVQCKIPIFSTMNQNFLPTLEEEFKSSQSNASLSISNFPSKQISQEEGDKILQSLQNQCAEYRTSAFLWQFCYKKYLRQFDDLHTLQEAQKQKYEDIYAGYFPLYNNKTNLTMIDYNQSLNDENYFDIENYQSKKQFLYAENVYTYNPHIPKSNLSDNFFSLFDKKVIQFNRYNTSMFSNQFKWVLKFSSTIKIHESKLNKDFYQEGTEYNNQTKKETFIYHYNIHTIIDKQFALANVDFPTDTKDFALIEFKFYKKENMRNSDLLTLFNGQYIYGKRLNALKHFSQNDLIIVHLYNQAVIKKIKKVWYHSLIELYEDNQGVDLINKDHFIQSIQIFNRYRQYKITQRGDLENQFIGLFDIYFDFTSYHKKFKFISGRYLIGFTQFNAQIGETLLFITKDNYVASRIKSVYGGIIELDTDLDEFNGFVLKANSDPIRQSYFDFYPNNKEVKIIPTVIQINQTFPVKNKFYPMLLSFKSIKDEISTDSTLIPYTDLEGFSFSESDLQKQRYFMFIIQSPLVREDFFQLKLMITDSLDEIKEGVEITFTFDSQILAYDVFNKKNIVSKNKRYENTTLSDTIIWILLDTDNSVRLGFSQIITPANQVLQLQTNYTNLKYVRFLTKHTINYFVKYPYLGVLEKPINFEVLNPNVMLYRGQSIIQNYYNGEMCQVINGPRKFVAEFICGESFFSILSVTEPSTCQYKVLVETYLLCEKHLFTYNIPPPPKNIYCILKDHPNVPSIAA